MSRYNFLLSKALIVTFLCITGVALWLIAASSYATKIAPVAAFLEVKKSCKVASSKNQNKFVVYVPSEQMANNLINIVCENEVVKRQYGSVEINWGYDLKDAISFIGKGNADLILTKQHIMDAFMAESTYNYQPVIGYLDYKAYFISLTEKPSIDKAYFLDKRIGLVDYPTSRSAHILPKGVFRDLDINLDSLSITYASSHSALRNLLAEGKVDIIASYWKEDDMTRFSENYITPMSNNISGSRWYYKMDSNNTDLFCALQGVLEQQSKQQLAVYFQEAIRFGTCHEL